jgi:hypothetical protein
LIAHGSIFSNFWGFCLTGGFDLCLDKEVVALGVNPHSVVLHHNLLVDVLRQSFSEFDGLQGEGVVERHLILKEAMFVPV